MYAGVYVCDVPYRIDRPFDYSVPENMAPYIRVGSVVRVPFGRGDRLRVGAVVSLSETAPEGVVTKPVRSLLDERIALSDEMLGLCLFLKNHTLCSYGDALRALTPPGAFSEEVGTRVRRTFCLSVERETAVTLLTAGGRAGIRSEGQRSALRFIMENGTADEELVRAVPGVSAAHLRALRERGVIDCVDSDEIRNPYSRYRGAGVRDEIVLTRAQTAAFSEIERLRKSGAACAGLLFGVTGSGKTKVIMRAIDGTIDSGKSVIMLVPEISLTPQTVSLFCTRYGERVAVMHSSLSAGERFDAYRRIKRGDVDLVIGTRSAIFAPLPNLGLIVIDEEHEHTYKSEQDPKYHARDVAAYRCGVNKCMLLLASATPSVESFYKAKQGVYTLIPLRERYGGFRLPDAVVVDMREELRLGNTSPISVRLLDELRRVKERGEQAILFLNRRGYNSQISCKSCGEVIACPRCSVSLTYHTSADGGYLLCHLCGHREPVPRACPACGEEKLSFVGYGTQKVEGELKSFLPDMPVMRMDADTTTQKLSYDRLLGDFRAGRADILLGTQMVAKGHDFPRVTLVGTVLADSSLYMSDFRAAERTFSLLTQVIGRAGRARDGGIAVIQTFSPANEIIRLACTQDYEKFYDGEIAVRRELCYPPFCDMAQITVTSGDERGAAEAAGELSEFAVKLIGEKYSSCPFTVFGPFEAQVYRLNEKYRMRIVIKCRLGRETRAFFAELLRGFVPGRDVTVSVDLNPLTV